MISIDGVRVIRRCFIRVMGGFDIIRAFDHSLVAFTRHTTTAIHYIHHTALFRVAALDLS